MDSNSKKPNKAGELQPYIPKGNGDKSGEYTFSTTCSYFCVREGCTKEDLKKILTEEEIRAVRSYTDFRVGCALNKRLRDGNPTIEDLILKNNIKSAVIKHEIKEEITVYRGITVPKNVFKEKFLLKAYTKEVIYGSTICSTSRDFRRALSPYGNIDGINLIFKLKLKRGDKALPIEDISVDESEKEVILFEPRYKIRSIQNISVGELNYKLIKIELERNS